MLEKVSYFIYNEQLKGQYKEAKKSLKNSTVFYLKLVSELTDNAEKLCDCRETIKRCNDNLQKFAAKKTAYMKENFFKS